MTGVEAAQRSQALDDMAPLLTMCEASRTSGSREVG